ncbi:isochorismatase hydrolase [Amycolatopsis mediterranei S699]|uniref:Isochorismatase hydrolase n=2 Tax=Amycolatopsis mediterranei TaxID=33910 RepID=A0A0H3DBI6_AMYMU|nr:isochorismatase family protein [Amycolatopsis mediterranei]ADJ47443.1 isochorismatase hydrolase [Amycolatopsis mediterranei U32]AEK44290.1 isochorismatase hydrolase [Amycolatopsis mediterranei S699]AFO79154.1 isochorismatase hydrolase [Amycolatopsis mediterranei S699]AGT86282.1 isochorismatase hydrolase [Amycolatopsis mediterranei RB]KDO12633.1 isochorismatase [Amycolatopsis mediterranei]
MPLQLFSPQDSAILLIDHQVGTMSWIRSDAIDNVKAAAFAPAKAAVALDLPLILTSSREDHFQGLLQPEFETIAAKQHQNRIRRMGVVNAWEDPAFAAAVKDTGRRNLIIAGVTNDVCTVYPTLSALDEGYQVQAVADAGGSITELADDAALRRMEKAGALITSTTMTLTELARNRASDAGQKLLPILGELLPH